MTMTNQTILALCTGKTQIGLSIYGAIGLSFLHADIEDSDMTGGCPGWSESLLGTKAEVQIIGFVTQLLIII